MLRQAFNCLPSRFEDKRHEAIVNGFKRHGYKIIEGAGAPRSDRDILLTWTAHHGHKEKQRDDFETRGGRVLVCEESYIKMPRGEKHIALAWHDHQGAGEWFVGDGSRWRSFGIELAPWLAGGDRDYVLVREQRGIGSSLQRCPSPQWHIETASALAKLTDLEIRIRRHPKTDPDPTPDPERLAGARAVVTWNSSMATTALIHGVPVIALAPHTIHDGIVSRSLSDITAPLMADREPSFERAAWAQWSLTEIENGIAADRLLSV